MLQIVFKRRVKTELEGFVQKKWDSDWDNNQPIPRDASGIGIWLKDRSLGNWDCVLLNADGSAPFRF